MTYADYMVQYAKDYNLLDLTKEVNKIPIIGEYIMNPLMEMATNPLSYLGIGEFGTARAALNPEALGYAKALGESKVLG
jgi:hypothetical protein